MDKIRVDTIQKNKTTEACIELEKFLRQEKVVQIISITQSELYEDDGDWYQITYTVVWR